ncbi:gamma-secretase subunit Aph-1 [Phlyctochytrium arcticum]|nr:gamma-secretase subunit Aph-1 [Phlyctochytrium arcticum]
MTAISLFGNALTAYGPALAVFILYVARNAQLVILLMTSAFFWLLSIFVASIFWFLIKPLQTVPAATVFLAVTLQEMSRYLFFRLMSKAEHNMNAIAKIPHSPLNRPSNAFVTGLGFGIMSGLTLYLPQLAESAGPAILTTNSCFDGDVFFINAITTCIFIFLHAVWNMVAFDGWYRDQWLPFAFIVFSHYGASFSTLLTPSSIDYGCVIAILICFIVLLVNVSLATRFIYSS